ncbi:DUF1330 domain-containing protein [Nocardia uniformis]|uniref:DUF1330 domain-containing protein n=1 Tax=Nocardia uniformis TaxID=53432 RepID=A0A849CC16_9NOCA|nr:DUF1330 domain-containing protein [Nocardia uniformis]NNH75268.1 DUF1330 domain-containing protein [Nocardia uniformis]
MPEVREGDWPGRVVVLEFPDLVRVRAWYDSPEYRAAREVRCHRAAGLRRWDVSGSGRTAAGNARKFR